MKKFKIVLPWLIKAYLCYSIVSETIVIGGTLHPQILDGFVDHMLLVSVLGDDYQHSPPNIVRASRDDLPELGAAALPIHDVTNPTAYAGKANKGW